MEIPEREFWDLSPGQFFAFYDRYSYEVMAEDRRTQILCNLVRGALGDKKRRFWKDFPEHEKHERRKGQTASETWQKFKEFSKGA